VSRCEGSRVQLTDHVAAITYFGEEPGVFLEEGFRTSLTKIIGGPYASIEQARLELKLIQCGYYEARSLSRGIGDITAKGVRTFEFSVVLNGFNINVGHNVRIDSLTKIEGGQATYIGDNVHIASFCHLGIGGGVLILEKDSSCGSGVKIITGSNVYGLGHGCSAIAPDAKFKRSFVHLKKRATLFVNVQVMPGVTIGENSVVLPGAVVTRDVPDNEVWGARRGVVAEKIGDVK
jgi:acetyltransferase-like isoleucine patch superfamily enzyme